MDTLDPSRLDPAHPFKSPWSFQATHPVLLERLAEELRRSWYDLRYVVGLLVESSAYQLSSRNEGAWKLEYVPLFARHYPRRLEGEEIHDAIAQATGIPGRYRVEGWAEPVQWAVQLPEPAEPRSNGAVTAVMNTFLRGDRDTQPRNPSNFDPPAAGFLETRRLRGRAQGRRRGPGLGHDQQSGVCLQLLRMAMRNRFACQWAGIEGTQFWRRPQLGRRLFFRHLAGAVTGYFLYPARPQGVTARAAVTPIGRARYCILVLMAGGPSHIDTFGLKEGPWTPASFEPTSYGMLRFPRGLMPWLAEQIGSLAFVRSLRSWALVHSLAQIWVQIGRNPTSGLARIAPHIGSVVSLKLSPQNQDQTLPCFVALNIGGGPGPGYLPLEHGPFYVTPSGAGLPNTTHRDGAPRFDARYGLLLELDAEERAAATLGAASREMSAFQEGARKLMYNSALERVFSFDAAERARYGNSSFGKPALRRATCCVPAWVRGSFKSRTQAGTTTRHLYRGAQGGQRQLPGAPVRCRLGGLAGRSGGRRPSGGDFRRGFGRVRPHREPPELAERPRSPVAAERLVRRSGHSRRPRHRSHGRRRCRSGRTRVESQSGGSHRRHRGYDVFGPGNQLDHRPPRRSAGPRFRVRALRGPRPLRAGARALVLNGAFTAPAGSGPRRFQRPPARPPPCDRRARTRACSLAARRLRRAARRRSSACLPAAG